MSRKTENRLEDIAGAAVACFTANGIKRTQMADIARAAHVSAGTLYLYVTSKEAMSHLATLPVSDRPTGKPTLPLANPGVAETAAVITARI
ncbi:MAG: TetR/AcrR family transcriptional regulator, partial [Parvibaculum sp.]|nr:TetR/AcrR family transcriptional regulator [Parvibaculum sp.]